MNNRELIIALVVLAVLVGIIVFINQDEADPLPVEMDPTPISESLQPAPNRNVGEAQNQSGAQAPVEPSSPASTSPDAVEVVLDTPSESPPQRVPTMDSPEVSDDETEGAQMDDEALDGDKGVQIAERIPASYTVKKGDTITEISQKILGSSRLYKLILDKNPELMPSKLMVGAILSMPNSEEVKAKASELGLMQEHVTGAVKYTVRSGDSLYRIAEKELGNGSLYKNIMELNPGLDPSKLRVGQVIYIPEK